MSGDVVRFPGVTGELNLDVHAEEVAEQKAKGVFYLAITSALGNAWEAGLSKEDVAEQLSLIAEELKKDKE